MQKWPEVQLVVKVLKAVCYIYGYVRRRSFIDCSFQEYVFVPVCAPTRCLKNIELLLLSAKHTYYKYPNVTMCISSFTLFWKHYYKISNYFCPKFCIKTNEMNDQGNEWKCTLFVIVYIWLVNKSSISIRTGCLTVLCCRVGQSM